MSLSSKLEKILDEEWAKDSDHLGFLFTSSTFLEAVDEQKTTSPVTISDDHFFVWSRVFREQLCWIYLLQQKLSYEVMKDENALDPIVIALWSLISKICSDMFAIRHLIEGGFEVQCRSVLRSTIEYIDLAIAVCHDRDLVVQFMDAGDPEKANAFWHKNVSKGRLRRRVSEVVDEFFGVSGANFLAETRADDDEIHSVFVHPTSVAGLISSFGDLEAEIKYDGVLGVPTRASTVSLRYLCSHLFHFINTCCTKLFAADQTGKRIIACDLQNKKEYLVRTGWVRLMSIFRWILDEQLYVQAKSPGAEDDIRS
jgi:hypothetical protein